MAFFLLLFPTTVIGQCQVNLDSVSGKHPPLLIQNNDFIFPTSAVDDKRILTFAEGDTLDVYCHGSERFQPNTYVELEDRKDISITLACTGSEFIESVSKEKMIVEEMSCNRRQEPRLIKTQGQCSPVGTDGRTDKLEKLFRVSIGWQLGQMFREQIGLCIDEENFGTIWTNHTIHGASIAFKDTEPGRPGFRVDTSYYKRFFEGYTSTKMNTIYSKNSQKRTVTSLLDGVTEINSKPIIDSSRSGTNYLAKGHLSPDAAFIYNVMQDATYYFINVGPQFQSFNNANWKALEGAVRDLAEKLKRDLYVVTGTHGILQYRKEDLTPVSIHLDGPKSNIPVPQYYWKVILDPTTKTGVAFIGLNDPHGNTPKELCTNRCAQMSSWVDWDLQDRDSGFMYCCEVEEAAQAIKSIPGSLEAPGGILGGEEKPSGGDSCQAGPCNCTCVKNNQGDYTCTCTCDKQ